MPNKTDPTPFCLLTTFCLLSLFKLTPLGDVDTVISAARVIQSHLARATQERLTKASGRLGTTKPNNRTLTRGG